MSVAPPELVAELERLRAEEARLRAEWGDDAYQAAAAEKSPQQKIKLLDDFVAKYPNSELLVNVYAEYVKAYQETLNGELERLSVRRGNG